HLVEVGLFVVSNSTLERAEDVVVLDAVALEHAELTVVHVDGEIDDELVFRLRQDPVDARVEVDGARALLELLRRDAVQVAAGNEGGRRDGRRGLRGRRVRYDRDRGLRGHRALRMVWWPKN